MKRRFTGFLFSLASMYVASASAQGLGVHVGPKAGMSLTVLDGQLNAKAFYQTGFSGGLMVRIRPSKGFAVQPELLYVQQGAKNGLSPGSTRSDYELKLNYLNVPVMLKAYIGNMVNIQVGPQIGLLLSGRQVGQVGFNNNGTPVTVDADVKDNYSPVDFAVNGGVGVDLPNGLVASVRLNYGFSDINNNKVEDAIRKQLGLGGLHNRGFEFSLGYLIGANKN